MLLCTLSSVVITSCNYLSSHRSKQLLLVYFNKKNWREMLRCIYRITFFYSHLIDWPKYFYLLPRNNEIKSRGKGGSMVSEKGQIYWQGNTSNSCVCSSQC